MKKIFVFAITLAAICSCGNGSKSECVNECQADSVMTDSVVVDSMAVDSVIVAE